MVNEALARTRGPMAFIVGSGRSGTSLLAAMLDAHPELSIAPESHFLPQLIDALPDRLTTSREVDRMVQIIRGSKWFAGWEGYDPAALRDALGEALPIDRPDALRMIYRVYAAAADAERYGEKTPAYVYNMPLIAAEIEDARFVHIVRDGRNVALSFRDASFGADDLGHNALNWQMRVLQGHREGSALGAERYTEVQYESLIDQPEVELRRLCAFLEIAYVDDMLEYYLKGGRWSPRGQESEHLAHAPRATRDWREQLTPSEQARLQVLAGKALGTWGYEMPASPTIADRAAALGDRARWYTHRIKAKTGWTRRVRAKARSAE